MPSRIRSGVPTIVAPTTPEGSPMCRVKLDAGRTYVVEVRSLQGESADLVVTLPN